MTTSDNSVLRYERLQRPIFPLDPETEWRANLRRNRLSALSRSDAPACLSERAGPELLSRATSCQGSWSRSCKDANA